MVNKDENISEHGRAPVYIPFKTFLNAVETLGQGMPPTLDRSVWPSFSGGIQSQTLGAFKFLGLVKEDGEVEPILRLLVDAKGDERKTVLAEIIQNKYAGALRLAGKNASFNQLLELFRGYGVQGGTLERAIRFFLDACEYTDLKCSPLWAKAKKTFRKQSKKEEQQSKYKPFEVSTPDGEVKSSVKTVNLKSGGTLSLSLSIDIVALSKEDRDWLFGIIDELNAYGQLKDK